MKHVRTFAFGLVASALLVVASVGPSFAQKLPASLAGTIPTTPSGKIAFIRDGDVWIMDADGANQQRIVEVKNADGRLSWAPDGRRVAFTRAGKVQWQEPENSGGEKRIYDVFIAYLDSAKAGNTLWWHRITMNLGGRDPEWSNDGRTIYFTQDMNANTVNAAFLNYQICTVTPDGTDFQILRKDWQKTRDFLMAPTVGPNGDIAVTHLYGDSAAVKEQRGVKPQGFTIIPKSNYTKSYDSLRVMTRKMANCIAPQWSPDGKWIAYIKSDMKQSGVFITTPDLSRNYLVFSPPPGSELFTMTPSFSADSKWLTFSTNDGSVYICDITGNGVKRLTGPGNDKFPAWSKAPISAKPGIKK